MSETVLPGHDQHGQPLVCPSCGAFVGALTRCPRCGARTGQRTRLRVFRWASVLLATAGLGCLLLMVRYREIPLVRVGDIQQVMNFAYVRVAGTVVGAPRVYQQAGVPDGVRFTVDDGSGRILVKASGKRARALVEVGRVPRSGDLVELAGSLQVSAEDIAMWLQAPQQLHIERVALETTPLGSITAEDEGRAVRVTGTVTRVRAPRPGTRAPWVLTLEQGGDRLDVVFFQDAYEGIEDKDALVAGARAEVRGTVGVYRGAVQVNLGDGTDLHLSSAARSGTPAPSTPGPAAAAAAGAPFVPVASITPGMAGREVRVRATLQSVRQPPEGSRAPWQLLLEQDGHTVPVVFWSAVADRLDTAALRRGAVVEVNGPVNLYRGAVQIKLSHSSQIRIAALPQAAGEAPAP